MSAAICFLLYFHCLLFIEKIGNRLNITQYTRTFILHIQMKMIEMEIIWMRPIEAENGGKKRTKNTHTNRPKLNRKMYELISSLWMVWPTIQIGYHKKMLKEKRNERRNPWDVILLIFVYNLLFTWPHNLWIEAIYQHNNSNRTSKAIHTASADKRKLENLGKSFRTHIHI